MSWDRFQWGSPSPSSVPPGILNDYLYIDGLLTITYYSRTSDSAWDAGHTINNVLIFDFPKSMQGDSDLRIAYAGVTIFKPEWFDNSIVPQRGDKITIPEYQDDKVNGGNIVNRDYIADELEVDWNFTGAIRIRAYRI